MQIRLAIPSSFLNSSTSSCSLQVLSSVELPEDNFFFFSSSSTSVKSTREPVPGLALMTSLGGSAALREFFGRKRNGSVRSLLLPDLCCLVIFTSKHQHQHEDNKTHLLPVVLDLPPVPRHPIPTTWMEQIFSSPLQISTNISNSNISQQHQASIPTTWNGTDLSSDWHLLARLLFGVDTCFWLYIRDKSTCMYYVGVVQGTKIRV